MKNLNLYYNVLLLVFVASSLFGISKFTNYVQKTETAKTQLSIQDQYRKQLVVLEKEVWEELAKFDITPSKIAELKEKDYESYLQMCNRPYNEPVSDAILDLAKPIFKEFGLDITTIPLIKWDRHPACASDTKLYINEEDFFALSEDTRKFTIAHEIQHIINKDHSTDFIITGLLPENQRGFDHDYDHPLLKYYRFREIRADLQVALKSEEWAKRYELCMNDIYRYMGGDTNGPMHPKTSNRIQLAQNIVQQKNEQIIL